VSVSLYQAISGSEGRLESTGFKRSGRTTFTSQLSLPRQERSARPDLTLR
jgi:hypothetical protein